MHALEKSDLGPFVVQCVEVSEVEKKNLCDCFFERKKKGDNFGNQRLLSINFLSSKLLHTFYSI